MKNPFLTLLTPSILAATSLATASTMMPAQAFTLQLAPMYGSTENTGSTANLDFNFKQQGKDILLKLGIANTTNGTVGLGATRSTLVGVAFDLPDDLSTYSSDYTFGGSGFTKFWQNPSLQPFGTFDIGISPQRNSFAGGNPTDGLTAGQSTSVSFVLKGSNLDAANVEKEFLTGFENGTLRAVGRYQQVNAGGGSDKVLGGIRKKKVPEPATLAGLGLVAGAMAMSRCRKINQTA